MAIKELLTLNIVFISAYILCLSNWYELWPSCFKISGILKTIKCSYFDMADLV